MATTTAQSEEASSVDDISSRISEQSVTNFIPLIEDVSDWISQLFAIEINVENIMDELDNGVLVCKLAAKVYEASQVFFSSKKKTPVKQGIEPLKPIAFKCHEKAGKESFLARENAANFISWCKNIGIQESILFESEGLVLHKQPKNVILTLLELGRIGERYGMNPVPHLVKLEKDIEEKEEEKPAKAVKHTKKYPDKIDEQVQRIAQKYHVRLDRIKEGKYILNEKLTIFVRILRRHVMVRVGGGWDEFEHFLSRHDPKKIGKILICEYNSIIYLIFCVTQVYWYNSSNCF
eukprot:gene12772-14083_t